MNKETLILIAAGAAIYPVVKYILKPLCEVIIETIGEQFYRLTKHSPALNEVIEKHRFNQRAIGVTGREMDERITAIRHHLSMPNGDGYDSSSTRLSKLEQRVKVLEESRSAEWGAK